MARLLSRAAYDILSAVKYGSGFVGRRFYRTWRYRTPNGKEFSEATIQKLVKEGALQCVYRKSGEWEELQFSITPKGEELERQFAETRSRRRERGSE